MRNDTDWQGESGYVNCLLTTLSEGRRSEVDVASNRQPPLLTELAQGRDDLQQWASRLTFDYKALNSRLIVAMLLHFAGFRWYSWFKRRGRIQSVVVKDDGKGALQSIVIERTKSTPGEMAVRVTVQRGG